MNGLMMDVPLTIPYFLDRAADLFSHQEIVTRRPDRSLHRYTYAEFVNRSRRLAAALQQLGVEPGERVATLAWNHYQHQEAYFGVPTMGAVLHTLNLRLHPDDLTYIMNHAGDRVLLVDDILLGLYERVAARVGIEHVVVMSQAEPSGEGELVEGHLGYEDLLAQVTEEDLRPPEIDERQASAMCYTSGTTGNPKGVVYSHRSTVLHTLGVNLGEYLDIREADCLLAVVPMFHVNAWGTPFACVMSGTKIVHPGPHLDAESLCELFESEQVTITAGVPTIWLGILKLLDADPERYDLSSIRQMVVGGSAVPESMIRAFQERYGLSILQAWGMTETSPLGTFGSISPHLEEKLDEDDRYALRCKQGRMVPLVAIRARGDDGLVPWDGESTGELEVRGPWVASAYFESDEGATAFTDDGWFRTGDIVTIDRYGYIEITDRSKDVIKSGGEWISSVALENELMGHTAVAEAAVIAVTHPKWDERPLAVIVLNEGATASASELTTYLEPKVAKWWLPDAYEFVNEIPRSSTGKFLKRALREKFQDYRLPDTGVN